MTELLNQYIWLNDRKALEEILPKFGKDGVENEFGSIDAWDHRGNSPLHLALMLGRKEIAELLLDHGASCTSVNAHNWDALDEAACLGDRVLLERMVRKYIAEELGKLLEKNGPCEKLNETMPECYLEMEVKLKSSVPVLAKLCPKETVRVWKSRDALRVDWTIAKIRGLKLTRSPMSLLVQNMHPRAVSSKQPSLCISIVNHEDEIYEEIFPNTSATLIHDLVEFYLREGVRMDELPLAEFQWEQVTNKNVLGRQKAAQKVMNKSKFKADVFKMSQMCYKQRVRAPVVQQTSYEACSAACRVTCATPKSKTSPASVHHLVQNLEALQFISESDLYEAGSTSILAEGQSDELLAAERMIKYGQKDDGQEIRQEDIANIDKVLRVKLPKLFGNRSGRSRAPTGKSIKFQSETAETAEVEPGAQQKIHICSLPLPPPPRATFQEYFAQDGHQSTATMHVGRDCRNIQDHFSTKKPLFVYTSKDVPWDIKDILPILDWAASNVIPPGQLRAFASKMQGFPVRFELPIFGMLSLKASLTKCEAKLAAFPDEHGWTVPESYAHAAIFPLVEEMD